MQPAERNVTIKMKLLMFAVCFLANGCTNQSDLTEQIEKPVESLYGTALNTVLNGDPKEIGRAHV